MTATATLDKIKSEDIERPAILFDATYADRKANVRLAATVGARRVLELNGDVPLDLSLREVKDRVLDAPMLLQLKADSLTLSSFESLAPGIDSLTGRVDGTVDVGGTLRRPSGRGTLTVRDGTFDLPKYGFVARHTDGLLELAGDSVLVKRLRMSDSPSRTDSASIAGVVRLDGTNWTKWSVNLTSTATRFRVIDDPRLATAEASWELEVTGVLAEPRVTGYVRLPYGVFTIGPQRRARAVVNQFARPRAGTPIMDGVLITLGRDVRLKSKDANVQLEGDLELFGPLTRPWISGSVSAPRGTYRVDLGLIKRTFRVDSGSVILEGTPDIPPALDIYSSYTVRRVDLDDVNIGAHVYGTTDRPHLELSSDLGSASSQSEIISYLVFGQSTFAAPEDRGGIMRSASVALVPTFGGILEGMLGTVLPFFSTLQVTSRVGDDPSNVISNPLDLINNYSLTGGRQIGTDSFLNLSGGFCRANRVSTTSSRPFWLGGAVDYRPKRSIGATFSVEPAGPPCTRTGSLGDTYQLGLDLSYEWRFGKTKKP
jgi:translocation and assembly module TamB